MRTVISRNPYSGQVAFQRAFESEEDIMKRIKVAKEGFDVQVGRQIKDKHGIIKEVGRWVERKKGQLAKLITFQTGKPIIESQFQIAETIKICQYYSQYQKGILTQHVKTNAKRKTLIKYLPSGTIYTLIPNTYPFLLPFYKCIPQMLLGNGVIVRNSPDTPGVAREVEKIMNRAGFQSGEYQNVWNDYGETELIVANEQISGVNYTGSSAKGAVVAQIAGRHLKKAQIFGDFESSLVIFEDGDVLKAVGNALESKYFNSGQGISPRTIIVHYQHYQEFKRLLIDKLGKIEIGDPSMLSTQIGPMNRLTTVSKIQSVLHDLPQGVNIAYQRRQIKTPFFPPTVLETNSPNILKLPAGPIFQLIKADSNQNCIKIANNLSTSATFIFSQGNCQQYSHKIHSSSIFMNRVTYFDSRVPLGSIGGLAGREGNFEGIRTFANIKTLFVN